MVLFPRRIRTIVPLNAMGGFSIINGQVYTPGLAIIDAPQPNTPLGGGNNLELSQTPHLKPKIHADRSQRHTPCRN